VLVANLSEEVLVINVVPDKVGWQSSNVGQILVGLWLSDVLNALLGLDVSLSCDGGDQEGHDKARNKSSHDLCNKIIIEHLFGNFGVRK